MQPVQDLPTSSAATRVAHYGGTSTTDGGAGNGGRFTVVDVPLESRCRLLAETPLFQELRGDALVPLARTCTVQQFEPGEAIVRQGEPGQSVYVIVDGRVEVLSRTERNGVFSESVVSWLLPGEALGELSLLDGDPRSATCVAMTSVTCLCLKREAFLEAMQRHWPLTRALLGIITARLRKADARLAEHATDPLTGVNNRRALLEIYEREALRTQRSARQGGSAPLAPLGVLFVDVDHFKQINDRYGHHIGDEVLRDLAQTLVTCSRSTDFVARYGGDEFVVLLPDAGQSGLDLVANRIRAYLADEPPGAIRYSVSIGGVLAGVDVPEPFDAILSQADREMYADKARHRSTAAE